MDHIRMDAGHNDETHPQSSELVSRIQSALFRADVTPEELCDLIQEVTGSDPLDPDDTGGQTRILELRRAGLLRLLQFLAVAMEEKIHEMERVINHPDCEFLTAYHRAAQRARAWYEDVKNFEEHSANPDVSAIIREASSNTMNVAGDLYIRKPR